MRKDTESQAYLRLHIRAGKDAKILGRKLLVAPSSLHIHTLVSFRKIRLLGETIGGPSLAPTIIDHRNAGAGVKPGEPSVP